MGQITLLTSRNGLTWALNSILFMPKSPGTACSPSKLTSRSILCICKLKQKKTSGGQQKLSTSYWHVSIGPMPISNASRLTGMNYRRIAVHVYILSQPEMRCDSTHTSSDRSFFSALLSSLIHSVRRCVIFFGSVSVTSCLKKIVRTLFWAYIEAQASEKYWFLATHEMCNNVELLNQ